MTSKAHTSGEIPGRVDAETQTVVDFQDPIFRKLICESPISTLVVDKNGDAVSINEAFRQLFEVAPDDRIIGRYNVLRDEEMQRRGLAPGIKSVFEEGASFEAVHEYDFTTTEPDNSPHTVHKHLRAYFFPVKDESGSLQFVAIQHEDYTERFEAEQAVRKESEKSRRYLDVVGVMVVVIDADQKVTLINRKGIEVLGYAEDEIIGKNWFDSFVPVATREQTRGAFDDLMAGEVERVEYVENPVLTKSGEERVVAWHNTVLCDEEDEICATLSSGEDVTERRQMENALIEAESKYRSLVEESIMGVYIIQDGRFTYVNPRFAEIFGYEQNEVTGLAVLDMVAPESKETVAENLRKRVEGTIQGIHYSFKAIRKDGRVIDVEVHGSRTIYRGKMAIIGSLLDITERKRAEESLQLFKHASESSVDGICIIDANGRSIYSNPACAGMHGYSPDELRGRSLDMLYEDPAALSQMVSGVLRSGRWMGETIGRRKDGTTFIKEQRISTIRLPGQETPAILSISRDVTMEKQAEESKLRMEAHFEAQQRQFYKQTILAATGGKLRICEHSEVCGPVGDEIATFAIRTPADASDARHKILDTAIAYGMPESRADNLALCVGEAATNALKHAGGGELTIYRQDRRIAARVTDHGHGMDALILPRATLELGYSTGNSLGMGYAVILALSDEVLLDTGPNGTTVVIEMEIGTHTDVLSIDALPDTW